VGAASIGPLTRSLADFAKLVELFDGHEMSFVSVTQQFNTTTSMGRLTQREASPRDIPCSDLPQTSNNIILAFVRERILPAAGFGQLAGDPFRVWMCGHSQPQKLPAGMLQDQEAVQQPKRDCRDHEQVHRCDGVGMIAKDSFLKVGTRP
jgi:hypothetical protein